MLFLFFPFLGTTGPSENWVTLQIEAANRRFIDTIREAKLAPRSEKPSEIEWLNGEFGDVIRAFKVGLLTLARFTRQPKGDFSVVLMSLKVMLGV